MTEETKEVKKMCWLTKLSMSCLIVVLFLIAVLIVVMVIPQEDSLSGAIAFVLIMMVPALVILALISAISSLVRIRRSEGLLKGKSYAIASTVLSSVIVIILIIVIYMFLSAFARERPHLRVACASMLEELGTSLMIYASDHDAMLPDGSDWCDALIVEVDGDPWIFRCKVSGVHGESSYALNKNAAGKKFSELPGDMVLLFETRLGAGSGRRKNRLKERPSFRKYPVMSEVFSGDEKVYLGRWNQVGGPEDVTFDNHEGFGCNVLFCDGHVDFVKAEDIGKLRWTVE